MERSAAIAKLNTLRGKDLRSLAEASGVTIFKGNGKLNKGWAGHAIERFLGLPLNSSQAPNFGSWELKVVPLKKVKNGDFVMKETMAITMLDPVEVAGKEFEESHVFGKLRKTVVLARVFESRAEESSLVYSVGAFDLDEPGIYSQVKADYDLIRNAIKAHGAKSLTGKMGVLIQPRTKGPGHGSTSRAFYARKEFVAHIIGLKKLG